MKQTIPVAVITACVVVIALALLAPGLQDHVALLRVAVGVLSGIAIGLSISYLTSNGSDGN